jgi:hypothetical protein
VFQIAHGQRGHLFDGRRRRQRRGRRRSGQKNR